MNCEKGILLLYGLISIGMILYVTIFEYLRGRRRTRKMRELTEECKRIVMKQAERNAKNWEARNKRLEECKKAILSRYEGDELKEKTELMYNSFPLKTVNPWLERLKEHDK